MNKRSRIGWAYIVAGGILLIFFLGIILFSNIL